MKNVRAFSISVFEQLVVQIDPCEKQILKGAI